VLYLVLVPALENHHDLDDAALRRAGQDDPWVMYLIVRRELNLTEAEIYGACAQATLSAVDELADDERYRAAFDAWFARSFRKVTLRASEREWARVAAFDAGVARAGGAAAVLALPPRLKSEREPELKKLQVYNPERASLPNRQDTWLGLALNVVVNDVGMGVGKTAAQVAHAALMAARSPLVEDERYAERFTRWQSSGHHLRLFTGGPWAQLKESLDCVVVRDAGLTEVASGTETVLAAPPTDDWSLPPLLGQAARLDSRPSLTPAQAPPLPPAPSAGGESGLPLEAQG
jgi:peptidyl-tRNA hydrolase